MDFQGTMLRSPWLGMKPGDRWDYQRFLMEDCERVRTNVCKENARRARDHHPLFGTTITSKIWADGVVTIYCHGFRERGVTLKTIQKTLRPIRRAEFRGMQIGDELRLTTDNPKSAQIQARRFSNQMQAVGDPRFVQLHIWQELPVGGWEVEARCFNRGDLGFFNGPTRGARRKTL